MRGVPKKLKYKTIDANGEYHSFSNGPALIYKTQVFPRRQSLQRRKPVMKVKLTSEGIGNLEDNTQGGISQ